MAKSGVFAEVVPLLLSMTIAPFAPMPSSSRAFSENSKLEQSAKNIQANHESSTISSHRYNTIANKSPARKMLQYSISVL